MTLNFLLRLIALLFLLLAAFSLALPVPFDLGWAGLFCWLLSEVIPTRSQ